MNRVIALGLFDGVHTGHLNLLSKARNIGEMNHLPVSAMTFYGLEKFKRVSLINSLNDREKLIRSNGKIDDVIILKFDHAMRQMPGRLFLNNIKKKYGVIHIVVGENFIFGSDQLTVHDMEDLTREMNIGITVLPLTYSDGKPVSSSLIRELLSKGMVENANRLLGHKHIISGIVQRGRNIGHTLGFPTLNIPCGNDLVQMPCGVYATQTHLEDGRCVDSITNIGVHPTFEKANEPLTETHLFCETGELYGSYITIDFISFMRPEKKFESPQVLKEQLSKDKDTCRRIILKRDSSTE